MGKSGAYNVAFDNSSENVVSRIKNYFKGMSRRVDELLSNEVFIIHDSV